MLVKRAVNSPGGGYGVSFLSRGETGTGLEALVRQIPCDLVIQKPVRQHPALSPGCIRNP